MKKHRRPPVETMLILLCLLTPVWAQTDWRQKPYHQWTLADAEQVLGDSPWAQTRSRERIGHPLPSGVAFDSGSITLRLRSAPPVRQALTRLRQIRGKYDQMSASEKASFDSKTKVLLECPGCADHYVVTLSPPFDRHSGVPSSLRTLPLATLKNYVTITNERGETRELLHVERPKTQGGEAVFFFERFNEKGEPLLTPSNKKLTVSFASQVFTDHIAVPLVFEFDVSKMVVSEAVLF